jgi:hypothetical protein
MPGARLRPGGPACRRRAIQLIVKKLLALRRAHGGSTAPGPGIADLEWFAFLLGRSDGQQLFSP